MMTFRRRALAATLSAGLFVTGCSTKGSDPMQANDPSQSTGPTTSADVNPQVALVSPVFDGDELVMDPVEFKRNEPQTFSGVGTVTLLEVPSKDNATFCFEPDSDFTPDAWFEANK